MSDPATGCLPHARGGVSANRLLVNTIRSSSPRTWGCFRDIAVIEFCGQVFPTHVGVFLSMPSTSKSIVSLPHARGGVSAEEPGRYRVATSSPRTWGCFLHTEARKSGDRVFPTHVGVFLLSRPAARHRQGLPHARGGVSWQGASPDSMGASSPRTWGCFLGDVQVRERIRVFPTHVGVFPTS